MKRGEKIFIAILCALLLLQLAGLDFALARGTLVLWTWAMGIAYLIWGRRWLVNNDKRFTLLAWLAAIAFTASLFALPFGIAAARGDVILVTPLANAVLFVGLIIYLIVLRKKPEATSIPRAVLYRSAVLLAVTSFFCYCPLVSFYRAVVVAMNSDNERLVNNMIMVGETEAYEEAYDKGDCGAALDHALKANAAGLIWLDGQVPDVPLSQSVTWTTPPKDSLAGMDLGNLKDLNKIIAQMQRGDIQDRATMKRTVTWKISRTFDNLYRSYRCAAEAAEERKDNQAALSLYLQADSALNGYDPQPDHWPLETAWSLYNIGDTYTALGQYDSAGVVLMRAYDRYKAKRDTMDAEGTKILSALATAAAAQNYWTAANRMLRAADRILVKSSEPDDRRQRVRNLLSLSKNQLNMDSLPGAGITLDTAMALVERNTAIECEIFLSKALLYYRREHFLIADTLYAKSMSCLARTLPSGDRNLAVAHLVWSYNDMALARYPKAGARLVEGRAIAEKNDGPEGPWAASFAQADGELALLTSKFREARSDFQRALDSPTLVGGRRATVLGSLAMTLAELADLPSARTMVDRALTEAQGSDSALEMRALPILNTSAYVHYAAGELDAATVTYQRELDISKNSGGDSLAAYSQGLNGLGLVALERKAYADAQRYFTDALARTRHIYSDEHPFTALVMLHQGLALMRGGHADDARPLFDRSLAISEHFLGNEHEQLADIHMALGEWAQRKGDRAGARAQYELAAAIYKDIFDADHPKVRDVERLLART